MTYIIAEIGQNHNGDPDTAVSLINAAKKANANAVKFTMRDLDNEMDYHMNREFYFSDNSYGNTYMNHRLALELSKKDIFKLCELAKRIGLDVIITFCSVTLLDDDYIFNKILPLLTYIKVASRDITNIMLLDRLAEIGSPLILSTGLSTLSELIQALSIVHKDTVHILHCVSNYPTHIVDANLNKIKILKDYFKNYSIGYSDHTIGDDAVLIAVGMGVKIIEKHITLNVNDKGSDHSCSLDAHDFNKMVRLINVIEIYKGNCYDLNETEEDIKKSRSRKKLMRSICANKDMREGHIIRKGDLCLLSPGDGIHPFRILDVIGCKITKWVFKNRKIEWDDIEPSFEGGD